MRSSFYPGDALWRLAALIGLYLLLMLLRHAGIVIGR